MNRKKARAEALKLSIEYNTRVFKVLVDNDKGLNPSIREYDVYEMANRFARYINTSEFV